MSRRTRPRESIREPLRPRGGTNSVPQAHVHPKSLSPSVRASYIVRCRSACGLHNGPALPGKTLYAIRCGAAGSEECGSMTQQGGRSNAARHVSSSNSAVRGAVASVTCASIGRTSAAPFAQLSARRSGLLSGWGHVEGQKTVGWRVAPRIFQSDRDERELLERNGKGRRVRRTNGKSPGTEHTAWETGRGGSLSGPDRRLARARPDDLASERRRASDRCTATSRQQRSAREAAAVNVGHGNGAHAEAFGIQAVVGRRDRENEVPIRSADGKRTGLRARERTARAEKLTSSRLRETERCQQVGAGELQRVLEAKRDPNSDGRTGNVRSTAGPAGSHDVPSPCNMDWHERIDERWKPECVRASVGRRDRVIECATVNEVTIGISARARRKGITRHSRNNRWSMPSRIWKKPRPTKRSAAWCHLGSSLISPASPGSSYARTTPPGGMKRKAVMTDNASRSNAAWIEKRD